jgi:hypothetical protein
MHSRVTKLALLLVLMVNWPSPGRAQSQMVGLVRQGDTIQVTIDGNPFTTYHFDPHTAKAYLQPLRNAEGVVVTRGFPVGDTIPPDHVKDESLEPHQRPLYFSHGDIGGYDFWGEGVFQKYYGKDEKSRYGRMALRKVDKLQGGSESGTIQATFDLIGDEKPFAEETQEFTFSGDSQSRIIDCEFVIRANHGPVKIGDTKEGTFAIRVAPELEAPSGHMVSSEGGRGEPQIWGKRANWVIYDGVISGQRLGIAIFDSPLSFRHPTYWHARGYGLFAANPFGTKEFLRDPAKDGSYTIPAGESIRFRYRVLIHDGNYKDAKVAEKYQQYAAQQ